MKSEELFVKDDIDFSKWMKETEHMVQVRSATAWDDELTKLIQGGSEPTGDRMPWGKTHDLMRFDKKQVTVWAGINGHGKSLVLGMIAMQFIKDGSKVCIASLEMGPAKTLHRMIRQAAMTGSPSMKAKDLFLTWASKNLWIYDKLGHMDQEKLFGAIRYTAEELGVTHFIIDNMGLCIRRADDYNEQKEFVIQCTVLAEELGIHIHIVHHIRKLQNELECPGKFDIKGGGEVVDYVHNAIIVYRNKKKEDEMGTRKNAGKPTEDLDSLPDVLLNIVKSRDIGWEGKIYLWYDPESLQYRGAPKLQHLNIIGM